MVVTIKNSETTNCVIVRNLRSPSFADFPFPLPLSTSIGLNLERCSEGIIPAIIPILIAKNMNMMKMEMFSLKSKFRYLFIHKDMNAGFIIFNIKIARTNASKAVMIDSARNCQITCHRNAPVTFLMPISLVLVSDRAMDKLV